MDFTNECASSDLDALGAEPSIESAEHDAPRCLRWFWAWIGAFCACLIGGFASWIWSLNWASLAQYRLAIALHYACLFLMSALILAAVWWKGTIRCENAACIWMADKVRAVREALEDEEGWGEVEDAEDG